MKLYEIANELREIESLIDSGEVEFETFFDTIEALDCQFDEKIQNCCALIAENSGYVDSLDEQIKRLQSLKKTHTARTESLKSYVRTQMLLSGRTRVKGVFDVSIGKPSLQVNIYDEAALPDCAFEMVKKVLSKTEIKHMIEAGEITTGAAIIEGEPRLTIK